MMHQNRRLAALLRDLDLGSSVAESDNLLEVARIETSTFTDLLNDRVDLIPGTKGSGKSALFRIFVDFLPQLLLEQRKVVVAHGVQAPGDPVFQVFSEEFSRLSEEEFIAFWCIYLVSLAHEQFLKGQRYQIYLRDAQQEVDHFRRACATAHIPEITARKSLRDILEWALHVLSTWRPKVKYTPPDGSGEWELDLFGSVASSSDREEVGAQDVLPKHINATKDALEAVLQRSNLSLWLMIDRLDEIFPRRSDSEKRALRGLLRALMFFTSRSIRVKVFLRDDMLDQVVRTGSGFTALTHVTARQSDTLRWTQDQILSMVVKRVFANDKIAGYLGVSKDQIDASASYRTNCFYKVFPPTVFRGSNQSPTLRWLCSRCADGRAVITPRDVLDLLIRAKQRQHDDCAANPDGTSEWLISSAALQYGFKELSKRKRQTYLEAEFPHLWKYIEKFVGGKTDYDERSLQSILGKEWKIVAEDLASIGLFSKASKHNEVVYSIPFLYRDGLALTRGKA
jgi:hypothetical protein